MEDACQAPMLRVQIVVDLVGILILSFGIVAFEHTTTNTLNPKPLQ